MYSREIAIGYYGCVSAPNVHRGKTRIPEERTAVVRQRNQQPAAGAGMISRDDPFSGLAFDVGRERRVGPIDGNRFGLLGGGQGGAALAGVVFMASVSLGVSPCSFSPGYLERTEEVFALQGAMKFVHVARSRTLLIFSSARC